MKATVDQDICAGCTECEDICPAVFEVVDGVARVKLDPVPKEHEETCRAAAEACPVEGITIEP